jgi:hypothetical protein
MDLHYSRWVIEDGQPEGDADEVFDWFATTFWTAAKAFYNQPEVEVSLIRTGGQ